MKNIINLNDITRGGIIVNHSCIQSVINANNEITIPKRGEKYDV